MEELKTKPSIQNFDIDVDKFFYYLNEPFMEVQTLKPSLVDIMSADGERENKLINLVLKDPTTNRILCRIRNPKLKISGFTDGGSKCINLKKLLKETSPDFGFDPEEPVFEGEKR